MHRTQQTLFVVVCVVALFGATFAQGPGGGAPRSPNQRGRQGGGGGPGGPGGGSGGGPGGPGMIAPAAIFPLEFRTIDGHGNNLAHAEWGAAEIPFLRLVAPDYGDGLSTPAGATRPSPRAISNAVSAQATSIVAPGRASDMVWQWGQFLDHDITETPIADPAEAFDIPVPAGDAWFDPTGSGTATIPLDRSSYEVIGGVRQQVNLITAFVDASNVYGSDDTRAAALRTLDGTGRLKTSAGDLLPYNTAGLPNAPSTAPTLFLAGDVRANEQVGLTAMHTLFVREHNQWADLFRTALPNVPGDLIYELARTVVAAEMQAITYREFLPVLLGPDALPPYGGYRPQTDPGISNLFATAAYRVGHTMLSSQILRLEADGSAHPLGHLSLAQAFFSPQTFLATGVDPLLRGLAGQRAQAVDPYVIDDVRNFLFGPPGAGGFDLVSLNIQRGRDHGLPSYNDVRQMMGRPRAQHLGDVTQDQAVQTRLAQAYASVDEIDAWVGLLSESRAPQALVGRTLRRVLGEQFRRLRDGDRYWYEAYLPPEFVAFIEAQTLSVIIRRNSGIGAELAPNVFRVP